MRSGKIEMISDTELTAQKVRTVLNTNKGEWFGNLDEGIDLWKILGKTSVNTNSNIPLIQKSGDLSETEELQLAARLRSRLDGDI